MKKRKIFIWLATVVAALIAYQSPTNAAQGPGRVDLPLIAGQKYEAGTVIIHNNNGGLLIDVQTAEGWRMTELHVHAGWAGNPIPMKNGNAVPGKFDFKYEYDEPAVEEPIWLDFVEDLQGFRWGEPYEAQRERHIAVHANVIHVDEYGQVIAEQGAWAQGDIPFEGGQWGWWLTYQMTHKKKTHFIDSPVEGLWMISPTENTLTDASGGAFYFPGESGSFYLGNQLLGTAVLDHKVSPLDLFPSSDIDDPRVINMARLLQSLDADADPKKGITLSPAVVAAFNEALTTCGEVTDWANDAQVDCLIQDTVYAVSGLVAVSAEDAKNNLDRSLNSTMFRKNVSRTPELASAKAKMNDMRMWFPALRANGEPATYVDEFGTTVTGIPYYDELGNFVRAATEARPMIVVYADEVEETGAMDVFAAVSRDDGNTWKRKNISRMADRSSFTLGTGEPYYGDCKKPVFQIKGNKILIAWTSKFARGGRPHYAINLCDNPATPEIEGDDPATPEIEPCAEYCTGKEEDGTLVCKEDYPYDDPYWVDDIWGVAGPQRSHDYTDDGYPEVGEVPYSAVWAARGVIATQAEIEKGVYASLTITDDMGTKDPADDLTKAVEAGDILWFKPERLTSGRRDANQVFMGGADGAGMAIAWQEDPGGLRPGEAKGPGPGWGGATTNHKTDIWYSYITLADFARIDSNFVPGGDPEHEFNIGRPKALVPMSLPVRVSDNDVVNTDNLMVELDPVTGLPVLRDLDGDGAADDFTPVLNIDANSENAYGSHRYGYLLEGLWNWDGNICIDGQECSWDAAANQGTLYEFINQQEATKRVVITADGRALDGNTGASRPNLFLQTYTIKGDNPATPAVETEYKSAWAILAYEESKGVGLGPPDDAGSDPDEGDDDSDGDHLEDGTGYDPYKMFPDEGKNVIYHSFDFQNPDLVSAGTILNLPETDDDGTPLYVVQPDYLGSDPIIDPSTGEITGYIPIPNPDAGVQITDWKGDPIFAYENARRPRFLLQGKDGAGESKTVLIVLYKEGARGAGRPSDIMARRCEAPDKGNPYAPANFVAGVQNLSTVTFDPAPIAEDGSGGDTWINPDRDENAKGDGVKVCRWEQPVECLGHKSEANPYEDARAHRGAIRGDFVIMGYSYTPNWAASRNAHDKYDFYIRRSFDGGQTWTTDPEATASVVHEDIFIDPFGLSGADLAEMTEPLLDEEGNDITEATKHYSFFTEYAGGGVYEPARNVSLLKNNKTSVIEPRLVGVPGTIKVDGVWTGIEEDKQNGDVFYLVYGTSTNLRDVEKAPEDLFYSFSMDRGTTLIEDSWQVNPDSQGNFAGEWVTRWAWLAKGDPEQGEAQIRMTPDGSKFYACWLEEGEDGSDIVYRRILPWQFESNSILALAEDNDGDSYNEYQGDENDEDPDIFPGSEIPTLP